jgi:hypothetical protein
LRAEALAITAVVLLAASSARAADDGTCRNGDFPTEQGRFGLAQVTGAGRLPFLDDTNGCPNETAACRARGYVVTGDVLLTGRIQGAYVCAFYPSRGGGSAGWVRRDRLASQPAEPSPALSAWAGRWADGDNTIKLSAKAGALIADGDAYWPSANPPLSERPGGPNIGQLGGSAKPTGGRVVFKDGDGEYDCAATLNLVGRFLVVADNNNCGGANVSFTGVYVRR